MSRLRLRDDEGSALIEFVFTVVLFLLPVVYLIVTVAKIQAAAYATELGARHGAMVVAGASDSATAGQRLQAGVDLALRDHGLPTSGPGAPRIDVNCSADSCQAPGADVSVQVSVAVRLPGAPAFLNGRVPTSVTVKATGRATSDRFRSS